MGQYTWAGIGSSVANNVNIGSNVVIAAGAVVINQVPNDVLVAGVPAVIKKRFGMIKNE